jgi:hypothetical protein
MKRVRQRRRGAAGWGELVGRFATSGLRTPAFCAREGISAQSLRRWRSRLGGEPVRDRNGGAVTDPGGFIDLGEVRAGGARLEVRLELGAGLVLSIARG